MENNDRIIGMQLSGDIVKLIAQGREGSGDRNIEVRISEEGMRILNEAMESSFVERMRPLQNMYNIAVAGIDPYRIDEEPIQDDDQIIF